MRFSGDSGARSVCDGNFIRARARTHTHTDDEAVVVAAGWSVVVVVLTNIKNPLEKNQ